MDILQFDWSDKNKFLVDTFFVSVFCDKIKKSSSCTRPRICWLTKAKKKKIFFMFNVYGNIRDSKCKCKCQSSSLKIDQRFSY